MGGASSVIRILRSGWWIVAAVLVVALITSAILTARETPLYRATTTLVVTPADEIEEAGEFVRGLETLERRTVVATIARIPSSRAARGRVEEHLGIPTKTSRSYRISASVVPYTNAIEIVVTGPDPEIAARVAGAVAEITEREARAMYRIFQLRGLDLPVPERKPFHPDWGRNLPVAAIVGLFVGAAAALARDRVQGVGAGLH